MIELYIKQQILRLYRLIRQLGPFVTVLILYLLFMLLVGVYNSPKYYSCGIYLLVIIIIQLLRKDVYFLKSVFGKRYRYIFLLENSMIAVPFEVLCVIRNFIDEFLLIFICAYVITLIPQKKINVHLPSHLNCCSIYLSIFLLFTQVEVLRLGVKNNELIFSIFPEFKLIMQLIRTKGM